MQEGYVYLETHPEQPGLVRLLASERRPAVQRENARVRYIARFGDMSTGQMHAHRVLRRKLLDVNRNLYRVELPEAMAAIEAEALWHVREWIDPAVDEATLRRLEQRAERLRHRAARIDKACQAVGALALLLLVVMVVLSTL